jgi:beta-barrel assembly-enhancing protease
MKIRLTAATLAVALSLATTPSLLAQDDKKPNATPAPDATPTATTPSATTPAATIPAQPDNPAAALPDVVPQKEHVDVKQGSRDDVEAIGNRELGKRGLGNWYSLESEIRMGKQYAQQIDATVKLVQDPVVNEYVNRLGQNLVRNSDAKVPFTIKVVDSDEVNAFALPGGFFYVNSGLILAADEEAELAGVMAHEIAHVAARHAAREMTRGQWLQIGSIPLIFIGGGIGYGIQSAASLAVPLTFLSFSRSFEAEADYLGVQYMYKSGYDPQAFLSFFEKLQAKEKKKPGTLSKAFSTHPQTPDRIEKSQEEIAKILPARAQYTVTTSEFDDVKARLAALENRRKLVDDKDAGKPTLRRTTSTKDKDKDGKTSDDDRPTLKRRPDSN